MDYGLKKKPQEMFAGMILRRDWICIMEYVAEKVGGAAKTA
jgi:hypothetical protein